MGKVLCVIDHFGAGGAQRQMVELACGLRERGHAVHMFVYFPAHDFFRRRVDEAGVVVHAFPKKRGVSFGVLTALTRLLRVGRFDAIVSFLDRPNLYTVLAHRLAGDRARLVVSERSHRQHARSKLARLATRLLNGRADAVVANSQTHAQWLRTTMPAATPVACIYNGFDLARFNSAPLVPADRRDIRLLAIGRMGPEKNALAIVRALTAFHARHGFAPALSWAGRLDETPDGRAYARTVQAALAAAPPIEAAWQWLGERDDIDDLLRSHHALVHASFYEGLPNVVCEALACGRPVLASNVCDHPLLVTPGQRGFLFDPGEPSTLLAALEALCGLSAVDWPQMHGACRAFAHEHLAADRMVREFEEILGLALRRETEPPPPRSVTP